jgi:hypothetical protein
LPFTSLIGAKTLFDLKTAVAIKDMNIKHLVIDFISKEPENELLVLLTGNPLLALNS